MLGFLTASMIIGELQKKFTKSFIDEFWNDAEFRSIVEALDRKLLTPHQVIEHLCKSKKELCETLRIVLENAPAPVKIIV